jgi:hypothetical protein
MGLFEPLYTSSRIFGEFKIGLNYKGSLKSCQYLGEKCQNNEESRQNFPYFKKHMKLFETLYIRYIG